MAARAPFSINDEAERVAPTRGCCDRLRAQQWHFVAALVAALAANLLLTYGGFAMVGGAYNDDPSSNIITQEATVGLFVFLIGVGAGPATIAALVVYAAANTRTLKRGGVVTVALTGVVSCIAAVVLACVGPLQALITFRAYPLVDSLQQLEAGFIIVSYSLCACTCLCIAVTRFCACGDAYALSSADGHVHDSDDLPERDHQPVELSSRAGGILLMSIVMLTAFASTAVFSPVFNYSSTSYFNSTSPYSLLPPTATLSFTLPVDDNPQDTWHPGVLVLKLYEDVVVYFAVLMGISVVGVLASVLTRFQRILHRRVRIKLPAIINTWPLGASVGELGVVAAILGLYCYWFWFWSTGYERIQIETANMNDPHPNLQIYARVLGHMTTLTMSLMILPVSRNSVWEGVFGMPFERAIKYHRLLGRLTWIFVTLHMMLWYIKWIMEGTLVNNITSVNNLVIANPYTADTASYAQHADNFTLPLVETAWLILTVVLVFAQFFRRQNYELFHYTHHAVWIFFLTAIVHAWSHWYYVAGGLMLYALDKYSRVIRASREAEVVQLSHAAGITRIAVRSTVFRHSGHYAGQYAFLQIPAISALQWHPFTISSAPCQATEEGVLTFHIRNMGPGTWTESLAQLAQQHVAPSELTITVDGPYGNAGHYAERDTVVLIAGGIGITPMHAILQDLHSRLTQPHKYGLCGAIRKVHLIWVAREHNLLTIHADTFARILRSNPTNMFELHLFCTGGTRRKSDKSPVLAGDAEEAATSLLGEATDGLETPMIMRGNADGNEPCDAGFCDPSSASMLLPIIMPSRPNMPRMFDAIAQDAYRNHHATQGPATYSMSDLVSVLVCGPAPMIEEVSELAFQHGMDFHSEVFHF